MAAGLPTVRADTSECRVLDAADCDPPTCRPDDRVADIAGLYERSVVVVNEYGIVLGRLIPGRVDAADPRPVQEVMEPEPDRTRSSPPKDALDLRGDSRGYRAAMATTTGYRIAELAQRSGFRYRPDGPPP
jgi:hypothetical protein